MPAQKSAPKTPSLRQRRVNAYLLRKLADILRAGDISEVAGLVTLTSVATTPDLREAKVGFSVLGQDPETVLRALNRQVYQIQGRLYQDATMRIVPRISFHVDTAAEFSEHISSLLHKLHEADTP